MRNGKALNHAVWLIYVTLFVCSFFFFFFNQRKVGEKRMNGQNVKMKSLPKPGDSGVPVADCGLEPLGRVGRRDRFSSRPAREYRQPTLVKGGRRRHRSNHCGHRERPSLPGTSPADQPFRNDLDALWFSIYPKGSTSRSKWQCSFNIF